MKIALIKQDVYQDLYVNDKRASPEELLFSSIMRVGPIGLVAELKADFYIIQEEEQYPECRIWEEILSAPPEYFRELKTKPYKDSKFELARVLEPGSHLPHSTYSVHYSSVDWSSYDIVISINCSVPTNEVLKHKNTLWCYMIGEANKYQDHVNFGYDVSLNQLTRGLVSKGETVVDFPYTFVKANTLYKMIKSHIDREPFNDGVYIEINSIKERPVRDANEFDFLRNRGYKVNTHKQNIKENLVTVYDSKYFIKLGGRDIRGNSVVESISLGTLVLMDPNDLIQSQILPKETWIFSEKDLLERIAYFDSRPDEYERLLKLQQDMVSHFVFDCPYQSLINLLNLKKQNKLEPYQPKKVNTSKTKKVKYLIKKLFLAKEDFISE